MKQMQGKQSILFQNPVKILSHACVGGKKEGEGPIGKHLDLIVEDPMFGKENWEESEAVSRDGLSDGLSWDYRGQDLSRPL